MKAMSYRILCQALFSGKPYFGSALRALQGPPERHKFFRPLLKAAAGFRSGSLEILEVGSWAGASTVSFGAALNDLELDGRITCVDPWKPYFDTRQDAAHVYREMNRAAEHELIYKLFRHNICSAGFENQVQIRRGSSRELLPTLTSDSFDVIYIDGSHRYEDVAYDLRQAARLLRDGGILCGDDLEQQSSSIDPQELAEAVQNGQDLSYSQSAQSYYHPGVTGAVAEEIGIVSAWAGFWAVRCVESKWEPLMLDLQSATLPAHIAPFVIEKQGEIGNFDLFLRDGSYFAVSRNVSSDLIDELLWGTDIPPLVFSGETLAEVKLKAENTFPTEAVTPPLVPSIIGWRQGYNLVKFHGKIYALHESAGEIDLRLGEDLLRSRYGNEVVMTGDSVAQVETRIDLIELSRRVQELSRQAHVLTKDMSHLRFGSSQPAGSLIDGNHAGFNLIWHKGRVYGIRKSLGSVDLDPDESVLWQSYSPQDLVIGSSVEAVRLRIDWIESIGRLEQALESMRERTGVEHEYLLTQFREQTVMTTKVTGDVERLQATFQTLEQQSAERHQQEQTVTTSLTGDVQSLQAAFEILEHQIGVRFQELLSELHRAQTETAELAAARAEDRVAAENAVAELHKELAQTTSLLEELRKDPAENHIPEVVENYRGFRLVRQEDRVFAIPTESETDSPILDSASPDLAKARIDAYLAEQAVGKLITQLGSTRKGGHLKKWFETAGFPKSPGK